MTFIANVLQSWLGLWHGKCPPSSNPTAMHLLQLSHAVRTRAFKAVNHDFKTPARSDIDFQP
jgi:hypothetical protein